MRTRVFRSASVLVGNAQREIAVGAPAVCDPESVSPRRRTFLVLEQPAHTTSISAMNRRRLAPGKHDGRRINIWIVDIQISVQIVYVPWAGNRARTSSPTVEVLMWGDRSPGEKCALLEVPHREREGVVIPAI